MNGLRQPSSKTLYDGLYALGYHNNTSLHHAEQLLKALRRCKHNVTIHSVLDVGCSHGAVVEILWRRGFHANGVDVSSRAVEMARTKRKYPPNCVTEPCFQVASAASLPLKTGSFDVVMSSDVLEHVPHKDVESAVAEVSRVAARFLILKISNRPEGGERELRALIAERRARGEEDWPKFNLHTTIQGPPFWLGRFARHGWHLHHMLEAEHHDHYYIKHAGRGLPWECCSYVLQPSSVPGAVQLANAEVASMKSQMWYRKASQCLHWGKRFC
jgi:SAM-dependent methyltransferase